MNFSSCKEHALEFSSLHAAGGNEDRYRYGSLTYNSKTIEVIHK